VEDALQCFNTCLESGPGVCLDRKFIIEAADGLQKAQVLHFFPVMNIYLNC
jgi:DnaJ family protein C protein 7